MSKISTIKGFTDHLPEEAALFNHIALTAKTVFGRYGYNEIHIPILEYTELFQRSIGAETDVVQKEMFTFPDRKGRSLTMRPEATAGIVRSFIEHSMHSRDSVNKLFTYGPMFRYERPQKGRMRQFHQVDCECLGPQEPALDAEVILMLMDFLTLLGLDKLSLEINNLGCKVCRPAYLEMLKEFLHGHDRESYCEDCQRRIDTNPLRVLDCKVPRCRELTAEAPSLADNVCDECCAHFSVVLESLHSCGQKFVLNPRLVRGLDYYVRTSFEVVSGDIGSQSSVAGGGRYDGLIASLGGPDVPGIGFGAGMERLALILKEQLLPAPDFYIASLEPTAVPAALLLAQKLRGQGYTGEMSFAPGSMKSQMRQASRSRARHCLIIGGSELEKNTVIVKNMENGEQVEKDRASFSGF